MALSHTANKRGSSNAPAHTLLGHDSAEPVCLLRIMTAGFTDGMMMMLLLIHTCFRADRQRGVVGGSSMRQVPGERAQ